MAHVAPTSLSLRPLACGSLTAVVTRSGAVLAVLPRADAFALARSLTRCIRPRGSAASTATIVDVAA